MFFGSSSGSFKMLNSNSMAIHEPFVHGWNGRDTYMRGFKSSILGRELGELAQ